MAKSNGQAARPKNSARETNRTPRSVMVRNVYAADGFFRPDAPKPGKRQGPDRGACAFIEVYA